MFTDFNQTCGPCHLQKISFNKEQKKLNETSEVTTKVTT